MADDYEISQQGIEHSATALGALPNEGKTRWRDVPERFNERKEAAERIVDHTIRIEVVFLLQTLVLPLLAFWILLRASRMIVSAGLAGEASNFSRIGRLLKRALESGLAKAIRTGCSYFGADHLRRQAAAQKMQTGC